MNKIHTDVTEDDRKDAVGKSAATLAEEILRSLENGVPYDLTFRSVPEESRDVLQKELKYAFELWANTWIAYPARQIISKQTP